MLQQFCEQPGNQPPLPPYLGSGVLKLHERFVEPALKGVLFQLQGAGVRQPCELPGKQGRSSGKFIVVVGNAAALAEDCRLCCPEPSSARPCITPAQDNARACARAEG